MQRKKLRLLGKKGQVSTELIIVLVVLLLMLLVIVSTYQTRRLQVSTTQTKFSAMDIVNDISSSVSSVVVQGDGANATVFIPATLDGAQNFSIAVNNVSRLIILSLDDADYSAPLTYGIFNSTVIDTGELLVITYNDGVVEID